MPAASVITQMTAQSFSSLKSMNISVSIGVQAKLVQVGARRGGHRLRAAAAAAATAAAAAAADVHCRC